MITTAVIVAACKAVEALFLFLCSPQGQLQCAEWRADREKMKADFNGALGWLKGLGK